MIDLALSYVLKPPGRRGQGELRAWEFQMLDIKFGI
jgi:hypothetical protein